jgi:hypothetical protein
MAFRPRFNPDLHPRGNPENKGQFSRKANVADSPGPHRPTAPEAPKPKPSKAAGPEAPKPKPSKAAGPQPPKRPRYDAATATARLQASASMPPPGPVPSGEEWEVNPAFHGNAKVLQQVYNAAVNKRALAKVVEPNISEALLAAVEGNDGHLDRFESRLKTEQSLYRKIQNEMVENAIDDPEDAAAKIRDSVRYTAVVPDEDYWESGTRIGDALERAGFKRVKQTPGWFQFGYRGRNDTYMSPQGIEFEVQYHTERSLRAANHNHHDYDIERNTNESDEARQAARVRMQRVSDAVPIPAGTPIMDGDKNVIGVAGRAGDPVAQAVEEAQRQAPPLPKEERGPPDTGAQQTGEIE